VQTLASLDMWSRADTSFVCQNYTMALSCGRVRFRFINTLFFYATFLYIRILKYIVAPHPPWVARRCYISFHFVSFDRGSSHIFHVHGRRTLTSLVRKISIETLWCIVFMSTRSITWVYTSNLLFQVKKCGIPLTVKLNFVNHWTCQASIVFLLSL